MARQVIVLALVFVTIVGLASAAHAPTAAPTNSPKVEAPKASKATTPAPSKGITTPPSAADAPEAEGPADASPPKPNVAVAGPIGEESQPADAPTSPSDSGVATLQVSAAVATAIAVAGFFF